MENEKSYNKSTIRVIKFILITAVVVFILLAAFFVFKVYSEGRFALREAKNVKLALYTTDIELYPAGKCVYAPERYDGLADGVIENVEKYAGVSSGVTILSYDREEREILMFTYSANNYLVRYEYDGENEHWTVDYLWRILVY
ncbi:MAG: hypothetical protein IKR23_05670 [Lachnospiraceae bacterium]|nr:hypothetical protein [Lachnospiraceae bacterium]